MAASSTFYGRPAKLLCCTAFAAAHRQGRASHGDGFPQPRFQPGRRKPRCACGVAGRPMPVLWPDRPWLMLHAGCYCCPTFDCCQPGTRAGVWHVCAAAATSQLSRQSPARPAHSRCLPSAHAARSVESAAIRELQRRGFPMLSAADARRRHVARASGVAAPDDK